MMEEPFAAEAFLKEVDSYRPKRGRFTKAKSLSALIESINKLSSSIEEFKIAKTFAQAEWSPKGGGNSTLTAALSRNRSNYRVNINGLCS